ncbi:hypothetical protein A0257_21305 [Hymenobacter psoromatis]|nr:hypothetical protein A0257_21305 [Hymenobacter psoromatis]
MTDFQRMAELLASGVPGASTTYALPPTLGTGQVTLVAAEPGLVIALRHLRYLHEQVLRPGSAQAETDVLLLSFQLRKPAAAGAAWHLTAVLLTSDDVGITTRLPAHTELFTVNLAISKSLLATWFTPATDWLRTLLAARTPVAYDTLGTPDLLRVLLELAPPRPAQPWDGFFYRLKVQELVYYLFRELAQRAATPGYSLRAADVETLFQVRDQVLAALATPPSLPQLARSVGMNEAKLSSLFRQVFGASIFQYYQAARMTEAKRSLARFSVSEVGYQLGFTNLSHFTRLFAKHHGLNPKAYQAQLPQRELDRG